MDASTNEYPMTDADKVAVARYCGLRPERVVALHENVMVRDVPRSLTRFQEFTGGQSEPGPAYAAVEVIYIKASGRVACVRHRYASAEAFLAAVHVTAKIDGAADLAAA